MSRACCGWSPPEGYLGARLRARGAGCQDLVDDELRPRSSVQGRLSRNGGGKACRSRAGSRRRRLSHMNCFAVMLGVAMALDIALPNFSHLPDFELGPSLKKFARACGCCSHVCAQRTADGSCTTEVLRPLHDGCHSLARCVCHASAWHSAQLAENLVHVCDATAFNTPYCTGRSGSGCEPQATPVLARGLLAAPLGAVCFGC